jgi:hypothetical protein
MDTINFTEIFRATSAMTDVGLHKWLLSFLRASGLAVLALLLVRALRRALRTLTVTGRRIVALPRAFVAAQVARPRRQAVASYRRWAARVDAVRDELMGQPAYARQAA